MSYSPINLAVFLNSYSGAIASMATSGWNTDPTAAHYDNVTKIAGAFAQAVDTIWDDATTLNSLQSQEFQTVSQGQFGKFAASPLALAVLQLPASWEVAAGAVIAIVRQSMVYMAAQGVVPGPSDGGQGIIRISENYSSTGTVTVTNTPQPFGGTELRAGLDAPSPDLYYGFEVQLFAVSEAVTETRHLTLALQGSYDAFADTEFLIATIDVAIPPASANTQPLVRRTLVKGSSLTEPVVSQDRLDTRVVFSSADEDGDLQVTGAGTPGGSWIRMIEAGANG